jgi:NAD(P)-dependent dehydrogenase (short-subunit alcohol dehydrogenase family)
MMTLEGKVAVITGASRGLGKAMAELFARKGARVVLSARSANEIEAHAAALSAEGLEAAAFACDVARADQVESLAKFTLGKYGRFDIWINNAGTTWVAIQGGNHAQFGWYGDQSGDNPATITREEQQAQIVQATADLLAQLR